MKGDPVASTGMQIMRARFGARGFGGWQFGIECLMFPRVTALYQINQDCICTSGRGIKYKPQ